jgi:large subunit ribosomal protein L10
MPSVIKEVMFKQYTDEIAASKGFILTKLENLSVENLNLFRRELERNKTDIRVVKNKILKKAFDACGIAGFDDILQDNTSLILIKDEIINTAKIIKKYEKEKKITIKAGYIDNMLLTEMDILEIAVIPSKEHLIAKFLMCLQSPVSGLVQVLNGTINKFVYVINAIKKNKG